MSNENAIRNLIRITDKTDPTLFRALQLLIDDLYRIDDKVFPKKAIQRKGEGGVGALLPAVENFTGVAYPYNLRLDWDSLEGAFRYAIRKGRDWDTATPVVVTASDVANEDPIYLNLVYGEHVFLLRAMDINGQLGDIAVAKLIVPQIPPPDLDLDVVISTVLLKWTEPSSVWKIDYYIVYRDNVAIGKIRGTFKLIQEQAGGSYSYSVEAIDIVGNVSTRSAVKVANLHDPSEYEFVDSKTAAYNGEFDHTAKTTLDGITGVVGPVYPYTWEEHYVTFGFASPLAQVQAGYPIYFQPSYIGEGSYEEVFDFGTVYEKLTVVVDYNKLQLSGFTNVVTEISYSEDGIVWSVPEVANSVFAEKFRYVKVKWLFQNSSDLSLSFISNARVVLNVILTLDSGEVNCFAADTAGTLVTYNKIFTDISSVTATPAVSLQPLYAVTDQITKDNFRILVFDSSGNRIDAVINWKARGVI